MSFFNADVELTADPCNICLFYVGQTVLEIFVPLTSFQGSNETVYATCDNGQDAFGLIIKDMPMLPVCDS